jgi:polysaccharide export outer membrane protein
MKLIKTLFILFLLLTAGGCGYIFGGKASTLSSQDKSFTPSPVPPKSGESGQQEQIFIEQTESQIVPTDKDYLIGPEDVLKIQVWDNPDLDRTVQISREGTFSFPLIGSVKTDGLSVAQLEKELSNRLADGYLINPNITIAVDKYNSKKVFVLGEVHKPGTYPLTGRTDLLDIISQSGGPTSEAGFELMIIRPKNPIIKRNPTLPQEAEEIEKITIDLYKLLNGDINQNILLKEWDTVYVPKKTYFYVYGEVMKPGRYDLEKETTVLKGITMAGGLTEKASKWRIKIIRTNDGKKIEIKAKMDQLLEPEDIISVPESFF